MSEPGLTRSSGGALGGGHLWTMLKRSFVQFYSNPLRTMLTLLGVVFGVGAVVAMMSIGEGAQRQILARIEAMGATSVHVHSKPVTDAELTTLINDTMGLSRDDVRAIEHTIPDIEHVAYRVQHTLGVTDMPLPAHEVKVYGVSESIFSAHALELARGEALAPLHHLHGHRVAVIGSGLARKAFPGQDPVGEVIRLDYSYFTVIGVLASRDDEGGEQAAATSQQEEGASPPAQEDAPLSKSLLGGVEEEDGEGQGGASGGAIASSYEDAVLIPFDVLESELAPLRTYHELDMISVEVGSTEQTLDTKHQLDRLLASLHGEQRDFEIIAPEELLRQRQETQAVFNAVLIAIAAISLLVGGIGVMNIMLANIMERISEIGLRRAIGARKKDIRNQFLLESISICFVGGVLGVLLGLLASALVSHFGGLPMAFAWESTALSFGISLMVGVTFGLMPAVRAANIDPIDALRGE